MQRLHEKKIIAIFVIIMFVDTFFVATPNAGGGGCGHGKNHPPIADASAGEPYKGFVNTKITFDGSRSYDRDGYITKWLWVFGDNTNGIGKIIRHVYPKTRTYTVTLTVTDDDGATHTDTTICVITSSLDRERPSKVTGLTVSDAKDGKLNLAWNTATDNVQVDHYRIYRDNVFLLDKTTNSYQNTGLTNGQTYTYTISAIDSSGNEGNKSDPASGTPTASNGGEGGDDNETPNKISIANISADEPYQWFVNSEITFDGSKSYDSDGNITSWSWNFGDGTTGSGKIIKHIYLSTGTFQVKLTVTDDDGATNTDTTTCVITQPNRPPTKPIITEPINGTKNTMYTYTAVSTDTDNDTIQYTFNWGDTGSQPKSSGFLSNATSYTMNHSWANAGRYDVTVTVTDNQTTSSSKITVYIDSLQIGDFGYLINYNGDGIYDTFYSDVSKQITAVQNKDGNYNIDSDGNGEWDYTFGKANKLIPYQQPKTPGFELVFFICAIAVSLLLWKKKRNI